MAFSGMINLKSGQLTLGGQFEAYKRGQLARNIQSCFHFGRFLFSTIDLMQYPGQIS